MVLTKSMLDYQTLDLEIEESEYLLMIEEWQYYEYYHQQQVQGWNGNNPNIDQDTEEMEDELTDDDTQPVSDEEVKDILKNIKI